MNSVVAFGGREWLFIDRFCSSKLNNEGPFYVFFETRHLYNNDQPLRHSNKLKMPTILLLTRENCFIINLISKMSFAYLFKYILVGDQSTFLLRKVLASLQFCLDLQISCSI